MSHYSDRLLALLLVLQTPLLAGSGAEAGTSASVAPRETRPGASLEAPRRPLIFIPGFLGTKLRDPLTGRVVWGTMSNVLMGGDSDDLALATGPDEEDVPGERMEPYAIFANLWGIEYYRRILESLESAGKYTLGDIDAPRPGDTAFVFLYDWRRDNTESAARLAAAIERLVAFYGDAGMRFDLLAHSQGGLIARWYVKYGGAPLPPAGEPPRPTLAGARRVGKVVMTGTPNRGCLEALKILHVGLRKVFRPIRPEVVFTMPSVYQMLPPPGSPLFADETGEPVPFGLYDASLWEQEGLSVFAKDTRERLDRRAPRGGKPFDREASDARHRVFLASMLANARRFQMALDAPAPGEDTISWHAYGGNCRPTLNTALTMMKRGRRTFVFDESHLRPDINPRLAGMLYGAGDGKVLMQSLLGISPTGDGTDRVAPGSVAFDTTFFVCDDHGVLTNNPMFQNNLFYLLRLEEASTGQAVSQALDR